MQALVAGTGEAGMVPCRVSGGRPRRWAGEVRRQVRGRLETQELLGRPQTHPAMRGAVAVDRRSAGPRRGSYRGSAATGPGVPPGRGSMTASSGRGAGRGTTVAQTLVQLARAAAQREDREAGRTREGAGGERGPLSAMHHPRMPVHEWGCTQASCCACPPATSVRGDFRRDRSLQQADGSATGASPVHGEHCHRLHG